LAIGEGIDLSALEGSGQVVASFASTWNTLAVDHRAVDGALGAEFLAAYKGLIEDPLGLLL
jgi:pyruvate dehydrogenase E2 component (dihydrolipoamide acetyltransferase)